MVCRYTKKKTPTAYLCYFCKSWSTTPPTRTFDPTIITIPYPPEKSPHNPKHFSWHPVPKPNLAQKLQQQQKTVAQPPKIAPKNKIFWEGKLILPSSSCSWSFWLFFQNSAKDHFKGDFLTFTYQGQSLHPLLGLLASTDGWTVTNHILVSVTGMFQQTYEYCTEDVRIEKRV